MSEVQLLNEELQRDYQLTFASPHGKRVLMDLTAYCFGRKSTFDRNDRVHAHNDGKRDVLLRISEFTNLSLEEIYSLRGMVRANAPGDDQ